MTNTPSKDSALKRRFGPTALITGASDGIGRAFAVQLAEQGFNLILVARRGDVLQEMALDLGTRFGGDVRVLAMDLSDPSAVPELMSLTESTPVGLVVAAAGFGSIGPFLDQDVASEINMVDLNCRSVVELSYGFGQRMSASKRGGIVLFGSLVGFNGAPLSATYAATKGFVQSFAEGIAAEMRPHGVSVLSVAPGARSAPALQPARACRWGRPPRQKWSPAAPLQPWGARPRSGRVSLQSSWAGRWPCCPAGAACG
jgi:short-subunit dehydrogenase